MMFSGLLRECFLATCDMDFFMRRFGRSLNAELDRLEDRLVAVYNELKAVTGDGSALDREATVSVFGYPHLASSTGDGCRQLSAEPVLDSFDPFFTMSRFAFPVGTTAFSSFLRFVPDVSAGERRFLREAADSLNATIRRAAERAGVHFIDVSQVFDGHDPCSGNAWLYGVEGAPGILDFGASGRSFHPTEAGHAAYADLLARYIADATRDVALDPLDPKKFEKTRLTRAGLPVNPDPVPASSEQQAGGDSEGAEGPGGSAADETEDEPVRSEVLSVSQQVPAATCRLYVPGERVTLSAEGFAAASTVTLSATGATVAGAVLPAIQIPAVTSDGDGSIEVGWVVPEAPAARADAVPRVYALRATGTASSGGTLRAVMPRPIVAYPEAAPCAADDAAVTTLGQAVRVPVLANDAAPYGGSLDVASVHIESVYNGTVVVSTSDGSLTYTPDPGFVGSETIRYWVYDNWGIGVAAELTVTVNTGCTITGTAGAVDIEGTEGDDVICVPDPEDDLGFHIINAKGGDDVILGGDGTDWIEGGSGDDVIYGRGGDDRIAGGSGADNIYGGRGFDTIRSADLADTVVDEAGDDWFHGYELVVITPLPSHIAPVVSGDEEHANPGETLRIGVLDNDYDPDGDLAPSTLRVTKAPDTGTAQVQSTAELGPHIRYVAPAAAGSDAFGYEVCDLRGDCAAAEVSITVGATGCTIMGTAGNDTLYGTEGDDVICGGGGDDVIDAKGGNDTIFGGPGNDTLSGSWGDDTIWAGSGDDTLRGNAGDDTLYGGSGNDIASGGGDDDTIWTGPGNDTANGNAGDDTLDGGLGDDTLHGGNGNDAIRGGPGADRLIGGTGADTAWGGEGGDTLWGNSQNDILQGGPGADVLHGGGGNDRLHGDTGADRLYGNAGDDFGFGGWGDDAIDGGAGTDYLNGGDNTDTCIRGETAIRCEA